MAAKRIIAAANRKRQQHGGGAPLRASPRPRSPTASVAGITPPRPTALAWSEQLHAELAATAESMRVAQQKLNEERGARIEALKAESKAQLEARLARQAAREAAREQRDTERKMMITAGGMRDQREKLEAELLRMSSEQEALYAELEEHKKRALEAELAAEQAIEEARLKLEEQKSEFEERVRAADLDRADALKLKRRLEGDVEDQKRAMEERLLAEKQKRIAHTQEMAVRRIGKRDLTRGWVAWSDLYLEQRRRKNMLKQAGARLTRPKLVASYAHWRRGWELDEKSKASMSVEERWRAEIAARQVVETELSKALQELSAARLAMLEGRGQEAELKRQMEERMAAEKEKRIEHTKEMALRRIGKRDLSRGWIAWHEKWAEVRRRKNMLRAAGAKITKPKLVAAYGAWRRSWDKEMRKHALLSGEARLALRV